jgi:hypothetical protein
MLIGWLQTLFFKHINYMSKNSELSLEKMANWSFILTAKKGTDASLFAETQVPVQRENQENLFVVLWTNRK